MKVKARVFCLPYRTACLHVRTIYFRLSVFVERTPQLLRLEALLGERKVEDAYSASSDLLKVRSMMGREKENAYSASADLISLRIPMGSGCAD